MNAQCMELANDAGSLQSTSFPRRQFPTDIHPITKKRRRMLGALRNQICRERKLFVFAERGSSISFLDIKRAVEGRGLQILFPGPQTDISVGANRFGLRLARRRFAVHESFGEDTAVHSV